MLCVDVPDLRATCVCYFGIGGIPSSLQPCVAVRYPLPHSQTLYAIFIPLPIAAMLECMMMFSLSLSLSLKFSGGQREVEVVGTTVLAAGLGAGGVVGTLCARFRSVVSFGTGLLPPFR